MTTGPYDYCIYLVRAWKEPTGDADDNGWRFALITSQPEQRHGFTQPKAICDALYEALIQITEEQDDQE